MYHKAVSGSTEAVLFVQHNRVMKEVLYPEFEAVLDHVVGFPDYAGQQVQAIFVRIDSDLRVIAAVFFYIHFGVDGEADQQWNIPLQHLLLSAAEGPDMGAGAIQLVCRSQCPVDWMSGQLWDPILEPVHNSFAMIREAIRGNKLAIPLNPSATVIDTQIEPPLLSASSRVSSLVEDEQVLSLLSVQRLQLSTLKAEQNQQLVDIHKHYNDRLAIQAKAFEFVECRLAAVEKHAAHLEQLQRQQLIDFNVASAQALQQFERERVTDSQRLDQLKAQFEAEAQARVSASLAEFDEALDQGRLEVGYRDEKIARLQGRLTQVEADKRRLFVEGGDRLLENLVRSGIRFTAFQPGAGEMHIDIEALPDYLDAPDSYAARHCDCDVERYRAWLAHYQVPLCGEPDGREGELCARPVTRVDMPSYFIEGDSNRCSAHTLSAKTVGRIISGRF